MESRVLSDGCDNPAKEVDAVDHGVLAGEDEILEHDPECSNPASVVLATELPQDSPFSHELRLPIVTGIGRWTDFGELPEGGRVLRLPGLLQSPVVRQ